VSTSQIIWVIVLALLVIAVIGLAGYVMNKRKLEQSRSRAVQLRDSAASEAAAIPDSQLLAREAEVRAERARLEADRAEQEAARASQAVSAEQATYEDRIREADRMDPDVDDRSTDYAPDTSVVDADAESSSYGADDPTDADDSTDSTVPEAPPSTGHTTAAPDATGRSVDGREGSHRA
jgi:hypothetical protein